jgi:hypothetical protein
MAVRLPAAHHLPSRKNLKHRLQWHLSSIYPPNAVIRIQLQLPRKEAYPKHLTLLKIAL